MPPSDPADVSMVIRADAGAAIGVGHVMRCLALAEAWIELRGRVTFAMREVPGSIADRIERAGARVTMIEREAHAAQIAAQVAVVDGYHLGAAVQDALAATGARLLVLDDRGETATAAADLILNQNAGAPAVLYAGLRARLLLGPSYTLIRREFRAVAARSPATIARRVLVSFGGADPANLTPLAIAALAPLEGLDVLVVAGMANPRAGELVVPAGARATIQIVGAVDDMAARMQWADLAVVAAGSICWELAACGVPMIAVPVADNQLAVADALGELGFGAPVARDAFDATTLRALVVSLARDAARRDALSRAGRHTIDGRGAFRVCAALRDSGGVG